MFNEPELDQRKRDAWSEQECKELGHSRHLLRSRPHRITRRCPFVCPPPSSGPGRSLGSDQWTSAAGPLPQLRSASLIIKRSNTATPVLWCRCTELRTRTKISSVLPEECMRYIVEPFIAQLVTITERESLFFFEFRVSKCVVCDFTSLTCVDIYFGYIYQLFTLLINVKLFRHKNG